ncbi:MAG TPA: protein-export chaperone SecB [Acidiferrobacteraceae bacterium]|nr:protein-export chaperone SecB [Acidiferrobacteraceae bacterium]
MADKGKDKGNGKSDGAAEPEQQAAFNLQKTYIKDVSFESPLSPDVFIQQVSPQIDIQVNIDHGILDDKNAVFEVVLTGTVTAKLDDKTVFLTEVHQAGVFQIKGVGDAELDMVLEIACPNILLPFLREAIADLVTKGGFPQLLLNPINFEVLYQQKQEAQAGEKTKPEKKAKQA